MTQEPHKATLGQYLTQTLRAGDEVLRMRMRIKVIEEATADGFAVVEIDDCIIVTDKKVTCEHDWQQAETWFIDRCTKCGEERA